MSGLDIPLEGKGIRQLCGTVLIMEAIVIGLAIPVAIVGEHANRGLAGGIGGGLAVCALLIGGVVGRPRMGWALWAGTVLQVLVIAAGVVVPAMYVLGVIFAALWVTGIWLARRHETPSLSPSLSSASALHPARNHPPRRSLAPRSSSHRLRLQLAVAVLPAMSGALRWIGVMRRIGEPPRHRINHTVPVHCGNRGNPSAGPSFTRSSRGLSIRRRAGAAREASPITGKLAAAVANRIVGRGELSVPW